MKLRKSIACAMFAGNGDTLVIIVQGRVEAWVLTPGKGHVPDTRRIWSASVRHANHLVEVPEHGRIIVTDTSGRHSCFETQTGTLLWTAVSGHEGNSGVLLADARFLFATTRGHLNLIDPATGADLARHEAGSLLSSLHVAAGQILPTVVSFPGPDQAGERIKTLCHLGPDTAQLTPLWSDWRCTDIHLSPDGERMLCRFLDPDPCTAARARDQRWALRSRVEDDLIAERRFSFEDISMNPPAWSPDGRHIAFAGYRKHLIVEAETLEPLAEIPAEIPRTPAFHPDGALICLCRAKTGSLVPLADLVTTRPGPRPALRR